MTADLPAGMKPWHGGDAVPADWDGGPVLWRNGITAVPAVASTRWAPDMVKPWLDIIAYTPRPDPLAGAGKPLPDLPAAIARLQAFVDSRHKPIGYKEVGVPLARCWRRCGARGGSRLRRRDRVGAALPIAADARGIVMEEAIGQLAAAITRARPHLGDAAADAMTRAVLAAMQERGLPAGLFEWFDEDLDGLYLADDSPTS